MKKLLLLFSALFMCTLISAKGLKVSNGSTSFLKENTTFSVVFDFTKTTWEKNENFKTWCGNDFDERVKIMTDAFKKVVETGSSLKSSDTPRYIISIIPTNFKRKQNGFAWGSYHIRMDGTITVTDTQTQKVMCIVNVDNVGGSNSFDENSRLENCIKDMAEDFVKLK